MKKTYFEYSEAKYTQYGEVDDRYSIKRQLKCKSFQWYLENIYPESDLLIDAIQIGQVSKRFGL